MMPSVVVCVYVVNSDVKEKQGTDPDGDGVQWVDNSK